MRDEFSVFWWDAMGMCHRELEGVGPAAAAKAAKRLTHGPAAQAGMVQRVLIVDQDDFACFESRNGVVTYDGRELPKDGEE